MGPPKAVRLSDAEWKASTKGKATARRSFTPYRASAGLVKHVARLELEVEAADGGTEALNWELVRAALPVGPVARAGAELEPLSFVPKYDDRSAGSAASRADGPLLASLTNKAHKPTRNQKGLKRAVARADAATLRRLLTAPPPPASEFILRLEGPAEVGEGSFLASTSSTSVSSAGASTSASASNSQPTFMICRDHQRLHCAPPTTQPAKTGMPSRRRAL